MILLLLGTHIFMTIRTGFIQRKIGTGIKLSVTKDDPSNADGDITQFGALTTALAATIGTGNIVGVGTGLLFGGPGAIFWMWITGILGIATKYSEVFIGVKYRVKDHSGKMLGGAMYALERGFKNKKAGRILGHPVRPVRFVGSLRHRRLHAVELPGRCAVQHLAYRRQGHPTVAGGRRGGGSRGHRHPGRHQVHLQGVREAGPRHGRLLRGVLSDLIGMNGQFLGEAIRQIIVGAFTPAGAAGGAVGSTITLALQFGFKRGIFSNESGLGSAPLVASSATTKNPARQALVSMTGTFWDTVVVCAITGLMLMTTLLANPELSTAIANGTISSGAGLATAAFEKIPVFGPLVLLVGLVTFAYSTILGWSQYGNRAISYLLGKKAVLPYYIVFLLFVFWGLHDGRRCRRQRRGLRPSSSVV